ncbi:YybH family protein [Planctomyces sp. SH-PL62]|uniref:YybH family protein n=1 Tax=Planctomyces sp. SH-PL62 TaxID=1636152 RepID=UPI0021017A52|nr:SgcJ/EcaC family oxidoreductase [Planctomyces sp. SH-PL62]
MVARVLEIAKAYEAGDAQALTALYTDDAVVVDPDGYETRGKDEIAAMYGEAFVDAGELKLDAHVDEIRFLTPDVARVEGRSRLSSPAADAADYARYSGLLVQKDGAWRLAELREYPAFVEDVSPHERLKDLEWMVGDWVNEGERDKVTAEIKWAENHSYLIRTYSAEIDGRKESSGTMFIGWDPQSGQIKSWLFDSQGGRGEGVWTRTAENQWVVKSHGVLRNGLPTSSTQIHTILNKDSVKTDSIDRILGGQVADDILDIVMVHKAPAPGGGATKPK